MSHINTIYKCLALPGVCLDVNYFNTTDVDKHSSLNAHQTIVIDSSLSRTSNGKACFVFKSPTGKDLWLQEGELQAVFVDNASALFHIGKPDNVLDPRSLAARIKAVKETYAIKARRPSEGFQPK